MNRSVVKACQLQFCIELRLLAFIGTQSGLVTALKIQSYAFAAVFRFDQYVSPGLTVADRRRKRRQSDLSHQREGVGAEVGELGDVQAPRHQDQPRIVGRIDRQHARQRELADRHGVGGELRVQRPARFGHVSPPVSCPRHGAQREGGGQGASAIFKPPFLSS